MPFLRVEMRTKRRKMLAYDIKPRIFNVEMLFADIEAKLKWNIGRDKAREGKRETGA